MSQLLTNKEKLQEALNILQTKATPSGGTNTSDATATADEIFKGETAYANGEKVTGTFTLDSELNTQDSLLSQISDLVATKALPSGTDTSDATATASDILNGKTAYVNDKKITGTITTKATQTYIPERFDQTIASGVYLTGTQTIKGDSELLPSNIKEGVTIFGVTGTHKCGTTEVWVFTMEDGSTVGKEVIVQ